MKKPKIMIVEDEATMKLAKALKPVEYFIKPVEIEDLASAIDKALQK